MSKGHPNAADGNVRREISYDLRSWHEPINGPDGTLVTSSTTSDVVTFQLTVPHGLPAMYIRQVFE